MKVETTTQEASSEQTLPRQSGWRVALGKLGEQKARQSLEQTGWQIIATNWRSGRFGEIDIVARDANKLLVFCEVKTRLLGAQTAGFRNEGFEAVHWKKRRKIVMCALNYMREFNTFQKSCRFDVIAVEFQRLPYGVDKHSDPERAIAALRNVVPIIRHVQGAFC